MVRRPDRSNRQPSRSQHTTRRRQAFVHHNFRPHRNRTNVYRYHICGAFPTLRVFPASDENDTVSQIRPRTNTFQMVRNSLSYDGNTVRALKRLHAISVRSHKCSKVSFCLDSFTPNPQIQHRRQSRPGQPVRNTCEFKCVGLPLDAF